MPIDFAQTVAPPGGGSFQIPKMDWSAVSNLPNSYYGGQEAQHKLAIENAFKGGLPIDANGNPDYMAAANKLYSLGDFANANAMQQTAIARQGMGAANDFNKLLLNGPQAPAAAAPVANSSPAPAASSGPMSLGASINNPGDLRDNAWTRTLPGYTGAKGGFAAFDTPQNGVGATDANLASYASKGINTPLAIASKWAPKGDGANDPQAYAQHIAGALGIGVNDPINLSDAAARARLRDAMFSQEGTNQGPFASATLSGTSPAGGPWAADSKGNPVATNPDGVAVQGQTPAALHAANAAQARRPAAAPNAGPAQAPAPSPPPGPGVGPQPPASGPQPQQEPPQPTAGQPLDPTLSGLVPQWWTARGGTPGTYATMLRTMAAQPGIPKGSADAYEKLADGIEQTISRSAAARSGAIAGYELGHQPGETIDQYNARAAAETKGAEESEADKHALVQVYPSDGGPAQWVPRSTLLTQGGGPGQGANSERLPAIQAGQDQVAKTDNEMVQQYQARQSARQNLQAIAGILKGYEPGAFAEERADIAAGLHGLGIPVSADNLKDATSFQAFMKDTYANIFSTIKSIGGRPLVTEIQGLGKSSANPSLQPGANQAILAQGLGLLDYTDKHADDYFAWRKGHPNASNTSDFDLPWAKQYAPQTFVDAAKKNIPVKGIPVPPAGQRAQGQLYITPKGPARWMGTGWQLEQQ